MKLDPDKVKANREALGLTLEMTAERGEMAVGSAIRAEHGLEIQPLTARRLARALNTEVRDLLPLERLPERVS